MSTPKLSRKKSILSLQQQLLNAAIAAAQTATENDSEKLSFVMHELIVSLLDAGKDAQLFAALDTLWEQNQAAYELLADHIEMSIETDSCANGDAYFFIAIPILVWSRNTLPSGQMDSSSIQALTTAVKNYWLSDISQLFIGNTLYTPDTLPDGFCATQKIAAKHFELAKKGRPLNVKVASAITDRDNNYLADSRFLLAVARGDPSQPFFKVLLNAEGETDLLQHELLWREVAHPTVAPYFVGCAYDVMSPKPYYQANRSAELAIRGFSLHAAILMVMTNMEVTADALRVVIAPCHGNQFEEYRVSVLLKDDNAVLQGVTWPLLGREETQAELLEEILAHLKALGLNRIRLIEDEMSMEYCDDCEAPLFPDPDADMVHAGNPDDDEPNPTRHIVH
jgi:hypothetical protein